MNLENLILELKKRDPEKEVVNGFGEGMSWRGSYDEAAFTSAEKTTFGDMLANAEALLNTEQEGYKGGEFIMHGYVDTHIADYGECGEPITSFHFKYWDER